MRIIQTNNIENGVQRRDPDAIDITIKTDSTGAYFVITFGKNIKHAKMYVLGYDSAKPVLVPVNQGGYKVHDQTHTMRFKLTEGAIDIFGAGIAAALREDIAWERVLCERIEKNQDTSDLGSNPPNGYCELIGGIDEEQRVWINITNPYWWYK